MSQHKRAKKIINQNLRNSVYLNFVDNFLTTIFDVFFWRIFLKIIVTIFCDKTFLLIFWWFFLMIFSRWCFSDNFFGNCLPTIQGTLLCCGLLVTVWFSIKQPSTYCGESEVEPPPIQLKSPIPPIFSFWYIVKK